MTDATALLDELLKLADDYVVAQSDYERAIDIITALRSCVPQKEVGEPEASGTVKGYSVETSDGRTVSLGKFDSGFYHLNIVRADIGKTTSVGITPPTMAAIVRLHAHLNQPVDQTQMQWIAAVLDVPLPPSHPTLEGK